MKKFFTEFVVFLKQYNVIGLAVAIIIGGKLNQFVSSPMNDLLMPLIFQSILRLNPSNSFSTKPSTGVS